MFNLTNKEKMPIKTILKCLFKVQFSPIKLVIFINILSLRKWALAI